MNWLKKISSSAIIMNDADYVQKLQDYLFDLASKYENDSKYPYSQQDAEQDVNRLRSETQQNMQKIVQIIERAISSINWNDSPIEIKTGFPPSDSSYFGPDYFKPATDAWISIGGIGFTLFVEGDKLEADDIAESDDEDSFPPGTSAGVRQDYYNLIRQLKYPNRMQANKVLTLYTARPIKDRHIYEGATQVPANIYLTTSYDKAEGIAVDLAGESKIRDIWKVRIEERYLMETLNDCRVREFQVIGEGMVPVKSISLWSVGE